MPVESRLASAYTATCRDRKGSPLGRKVATRQLRVLLTRARSFQVDQARQRKRVVYIATEVQKCRRLFPLEPRLPTLAGLEKNSKHGAEKAKSKTGKTNLLVPARGGATITMEKRITRKVGAEE